MARRSIRGRRVHQSPWSQPDHSHHQYGLRRARRGNASGQVWSHRPGVPAQGSRQGALQTVQAVGGARHRGGTTTPPSPAALPACSSQGQGRRSVGPRTATQPCAARSTRRQERRWHVPRRSASHERQAVLLRMCQRKASSETAQDLMRLASTRFDVCACEVTTGRASLPTDVRVLRHRLASGGRSAGLKHGPAVSPTEAGGITASCPLIAQSNVAVRSHVSSSPTRGLAETDGCAHTLTPVEASTAPSKHRTAPATGSTTPEGVADGHFGPKAGVDQSEGVSHRNGGCQSRSLQNVRWHLDMGVQK